MCAREAVGLRLISERRSLGVSGGGWGVPAAAAEVLVEEFMLRALLLVEAVHVELAHEGGEVLMFEVLREDLPDEVGLALDHERRAFRSPAHDVVRLLFLECSTPLHPLFRRFFLEKKAPGFVYSSLIITQDSTTQKPKIHKNSTVISINT